MSKNCCVLSGEVSHKQWPDKNTGQMTFAIELMGTGFTRMIIFDDVASRDVVPEGNFTIVFAVAHSSKGDMRVRGALLVLPGEVNVVEHLQPLAINGGSSAETPAEESTGRRRRSSEAA